MRILIAHNSYQQRGGEDVVAEAEVELLRSHGHQIEFFRTNNDGIRNMSNGALARTSIWATDCTEEIARVCDAFGPELIHAHNTFPLISPALYWLAAKRRIPMVQTLHNFRLLCPQAMFLRDGKACEDCLARPPWRAVVRKCYRESAVQTSVVASMLMLHRLIGSYREKVTSYIALSRFGREKFIEGGLPAERIHVKPNFVESAAIPKWNERRGGIFVGRLSAEKGVATLIDAARQLPQVFNSSADLPGIRVVGAGPMEASVKKQFHGEYLGPMPSAEVFQLLRGAQFAVVPSICYETFGLVAVEAFSCGTPVIASRHGSLAELICDGVTGLLFKPGDARDLAEKIRWAHQHPHEMADMGRAAYAEYSKKYTPVANYRLLTDIYRNAILKTQGVAYAR